MMLIRRHRKKRRRSRLACSDDDESPDDDAEQVPSRTDFLPHFNTTVYFYESLNTNSVLKLQLTLQHVQQRARMHLPPGAQVQLTLFVQSPGGYAMAGLAAYDVLKTCRAHVTTIAIGSVASASTLLFLGGSRRLIAPNAEFLIHQLSAQVAGSNAILRDEMQNNKETMTRMVRIYAENSNMRKKQVRAQLANEKCLDADAVVECGMAHAIWI